MKSWLCENGLEMETLQKSVAETETDGEQKIPSLRQQLAKLGKEIYSNGKCGL